jgi:signal transduction histidine kinase
VQQHLIALSVKLQLLARMFDDDPSGANALLEEMGRDVQQALDEAGQLAQRIYPRLIESLDLAAALRAAAAGAGARASIDVEVVASYPPEVATTVYACFLHALDDSPEGVRFAVTVGADEATLTFAIAAVDSGSETAPRDPGGELGDLRDRVEALGGDLETVWTPGVGVQMSGSIPLAQ